MLFEVVFSASLDLHTSHTIRHQAICFTAFLVGFITVLCIGNYFRAKRAQDRQRQRRLAKLTEDGNFVGDPYAGANGDDVGGDYAPPQVSPAMGVQV